MRSVLSNQKKLKGRETVVKLGICGFSFIVVVRT